MLMSTLTLSAEQARDIRNNSAELYGIDLSTLPVGGDGLGNGR